MSLVNNEQENGAIGGLNFNFGLTNARSLWNKMQSLYEHFSDLKLDCAIVTESWFYESPALEKLKCDALNGHSINLIGVSRIPKGRRNRGGGVVIASRVGRMEMKKYKIRTNGHEIVAARGKIRNNTRPFFVIGVYVSTRLKTKKVNDLIDTLLEAIVRVKTDAKNPYIVIGGDFNNADISPILSSFPDLAVSSSTPTRGMSLLDIALTSFDNEIRLRDTRAPLINLENGCSSDHDFVWIGANLQHRHEFTWVEKRYRRIKPVKVQEAIPKINEIVWENELPTLEEEPEEYVNQLHGTLLEIVDGCLP